MRVRIFAAALAAVAIATPPATAQRFAGPAATDSLTAATLGAPVLLDTMGMFQARFAKVGDDVFVGGQPTERALRELKAQGVTAVINLRTPEEMRRSVRFDEEALVKSLGMRYVYLPVRGNDQFPYTRETLAGFTEAVRNADGKVLLHCTIAWRASHLWAAYLIEERRVPVDAALTHARMINLMDDHRMGSSGRQPIEDFLGRSVPGLGRGSH